MNNYYVVYDLEDNLVCYLDNNQDLCNFTGIRKKDINYRFNISNNEYIQVILSNKLLKVYRFC